MGCGDEYKKMIRKRTGISPGGLVCPREKSEMTPCVARDGDLAVATGPPTVSLCVGCGCRVDVLIAKEGN